MIENLIRENIRNLKPYQSARDEYQDSSGIFLDANERPDGNYNRYPDPYQRALKKEIAAWKSVEENQLFLGNGSDEAIDLLVRMCCEPKEDKILTISPTYGMYEVAANIQGVEMMKVPLDSAFQLDVTQMKSIMTKARPKLTFLCSPNNPTGNCLRISDIKSMLEMEQGLVVVDEAYIDFTQYPSLITMLNTYSNLVVLQTFSKAWGLAGIRLGMCFANPEIISYLNKVKPPYNINSITQEVALEALRNQISYHASLEQILSEKEKLEKAFKELSIVKKVYPSEANFILIEVENPNELYQQLIHHGVIVRNRNSLIEGCLRITVGSPSENKTLLQTLETLSNEKSTVY